MAKALKPLIIILFILSIGALALGILLFGQREVAKGRIVKLEKGHVDVARGIQHKTLNSQRLMDYEAMDGQIGPLVQAARNLKNNFDTTSNELVNTEAELADTQQTLQVTRTELQDSQEEVAELNDTVRDKETEIAAKQQAITTLEQDKETLTSQVSGLENDLNLAQDDLAEWDAKYRSLDEAFQECVHEVEALKGSTDEGGEETDVQFFGEILVSNPDWNFVIVNGGSADQLGNGMIFLVHRNTEPVGKIRLRKVDTKLSVADIITEWTDDSLGVGDQVIPPKGPSGGASS